MEYKTGTKIPPGFIKQEGIEEQIIAGLNTSERLAFQVNR
jgi:hypothetical protein